MSSELIVTSAARGLQAGRSGFTTVLRTRGMHPDLVSRLEAASAYRHVFPQGDPRNPVIFSYTKRPSAVGDAWVLSRIGDAGTDYTGRSNKIAHHIALQPADIAALSGSNPAALLEDLVAHRGLLPKWEGEPRENPIPPQLPNRPMNPAACTRWGSVCGDPGWAGVLVEHALNREATWVIAPHGTDLLALFAEALALVNPAQRWQIPFTTYSLRGDEGQWLGTTAGSPEAEAALAQHRVAVIDLRSRSTVSTTGPYVLAARGQTGVPWQRSTVIAPARMSPSATQIGAAGNPQPATRTPEGVGSTHMQAGMPPVLLRGAPMAAGNPPDMPTYVEIPITGKRKRSRLPLILTLAAALLLLVFTGLGFAVYRLLPEEHRIKVDTFAWQRSLTDVPPPVVKAANDTRAKLQNQRESFLKAVGSTDISRHPFLQQLKGDTQSLLKKLEEDLGDKTKSRSVDLQALEKTTADAAGYVERLKRFADPELLDAHDRAVRKLDALLQNELSSSPDIAKARENLVNLVRDAEAPTSSRDAIVKLTNDLQSAIDRYRENPSVTNPPASTAAITEPEPASVDTEIAAQRTAFSLIVDAAKVAGNKPKQSLLGCEPNGQKVLLEWTEDAKSSSLDTIEIYLPNDPVDITMKKTLSNGTIVEWTCSTIEGGKQVTLGKFTLNQKQLFFTMGKESPQHLFGVPFMPLAIHESTHANQPTWVQLMQPLQFKASHPKGEKTPIDRVTIPIKYGEGVASLKIPDSVSSSCFVRQACVAIAESDAIEIAPYKTVTWGDQVNVDEIQMSGVPVKLWWRPSLKQSPRMKKADGFADIAEFSCEVNGGRLNQFAIRLIFEREDYPPRLAKYVDSQREVQMRDWKAEILEYATLDEWEALSVRLSNASEARSKDAKENIIRPLVNQLYPPPEQDPQKPDPNFGKTVNKWGGTSMKREQRIDELTQRLRSSGRFDDYAKKGLGWKATDPEKPNEKDEVALKRYRDQLKVLNNYKAEDKHLRLWVEGEMTREKFIGTEQEMFLMWLWRNFYGADPASLDNSENKQAGMAELWNGRLNAAEIAVEADVVCKWGWVTDRELPRFTVVASSRGKGVSQGNSEPGVNEGGGK